MTCLNWCNDREKFRRALGATVVSFCRLYRNPSGYNLGCNLGYNLGCSRSHSRPQFNILRFQDVIGRVIHWSNPDCVASLIPELFTCLLQNSQSEMTIVPDISISFYSYYSSIAREARFNLLCPNHASIIDMTIIFSHSLLNSYLVAIDIGDQ